MLDTIGLHSTNRTSIYGRRPDVIAIQKDKNLWQIIYFTRAYDGRVDTKELEKIEH